MENFFQCLFFFPLRPLFISLCPPPLSAHLPLLLLFLLSLSAPSLAFPSPFIRVSPLPLQFFSPFVLPSSLPIHPFVSAPFSSRFLRLCVYFLLLLLFYLFLLSLFFFPFSRFAFGPHDSAYEFDALCANDCCCCCCFIIAGVLDARRFPF